MNGFDPRRLTRPLPLAQRLALARFLHRRARRPASPHAVAVPDLIERLAARHGFTPAQAAELRRRLDQRPPITSLRGVLGLGGLITAIKRGTIGNARWGRTMLARRGGLARATGTPSLAELSQRETYKRYAEKELRRLRAQGKELMFDPIHLRRDFEARRDGLTEAERLFGSRRPPRS